MTNRSGRIRRVDGLPQPLLEFPGDRGDRTMARFLGAAVLAFGIVCSAAFADAPGDTKDADAEFFAGHFAHAQKLYEAVEPTSPSYEPAQRQLGVIALYENRLDDADRSEERRVGKE